MSASVFVKIVHQFIRIIIYILFLLLQWEGKKLEPCGALVRQLFTLVSRVVHKLSVG